MNQTQRSVGHNALELSKRRPLGWIPRLLALLLPSAGRGSGGGVVVVVGEVALLPSPPLSPSSGPSPFLPVGALCLGEAGAEV